MELIIAADGQGVELVDPENLRALAVRVPSGVDDTAADAVLRRAGLGSVQGGHAWLDPTSVARAATAAGVGPDWDDGFAGMLAYAREHGWWRESDATVRAHLARTGEADHTPPERRTH